MSTIAKRISPKKINYVQNPFTPETDIPVVFGSSEWEATGRNIVCGMDLFASSFFMLTRWEEYANPVRDLYDRFPVEASLAYKFQFLDRPVVL